MSEFYLDKKYHTPALIVTAILFTVISALGSPFRFADSNSGRYLPAMYRLMDPQLFQNDVVVDAFARFHSLFYSGLGAILGSLHIPVSQVEPIFFGLYLLSKFALVLSLFWLVRAFDRGIGAYLLIAAWVVHEKSAGVGGDSIFAPSLTHATIAFLLGTIALGFLFRQKYFWFWMLLSFALLVHSLITIQLVMMTSPVVLIQERARLTRANWVGLFIFGAAFLFYWLTMTPPAFSAEETHLFLDLKGGMVHVSPLSQTLLGWINLLVRLLLTFFVYRKFFAGQKMFDRLMGSVILGVFLAPGFGFFATLTGNLQLTQLQPMRMLEWVNFLIFILIALGVTKAWKADPILAIALLAVVLLSILDSLWGLAWILYGLVILLLDQTVVNYPSIHLLPFLQRFTRTFGVVFLFILALLGIIFSRHLPYESLGDPFPVLVIFLCLLSGIIANSADRWKLVFASCAILISLVARSMYVHEYINAREDPDFIATCAWIASHTSESARFITAVTQPNASNFRARALRTSVNEGQSALYWVAPLVGQENGKMSSKVLSAWDGNKWNMISLLGFSKEWDVNYLLVEGRFDSDATVIFQKGNYTVLIFP